MGVETFGRLDDFDRVDESEHTQNLIAFLAWADAKPDVVARRRRSYELLGIRAGERVADVGCGIGTVLTDLRSLGAQAVGIDVSDAMVREATRRVPGAELYVADAAALPLEDGSVDGYRAERVYQWLADPAGALAEAMRVLRQGGRIVLVDQDYDAFLVDGDDRELTRAMLRAFADSLPNGWAGRRHRAALLAAGFVDVDVEAEIVTRIDYEYIAPVLPAMRATAIAAGGIDEEAADAWLEEQRRRADEGRFFAAMTHFLASATRP